MSVLGEDDYERWNRVVAESPDGSIYSTPEYLDVLREAAGGRFRVVGAWRGDELVGGIALYERAARLGVYVAPRLLLYYNGLVVRRYATKYPSEATARHVETVNALAEWVANAGYAHVELKSRSSFTDARPFLARGWVAAPVYTYVVPLTDIDAQWGRVEQNLRRLVARCSDRGIEIADDGAFADYFRLHVATHELKGAPLYLPRTPYERWFRRLEAAGLCRLYVARLPDGRAVAAQLVLLGGHPVTHTVSAAADADFQRLGVSAFLRWKVFEDLARRGYVANDLTDATLNSVTRFKSQLGGDLEVCFAVSRTSVRFGAARGALAVARRLRRHITA